MADVQLEHGFIRIANTLYAAINLAPFNATQLRIVHCIMRLTYGWDRKSVRISQPELAERCGVPLFNNGRPGGAFRDSMHELLRENVVLELELPTGSTPAAYAINKNFEEWGRFSVAAKRVEKLFGERPPSVDRRPSNRPENGRPTDRPVPESPARPQAIQRPADGPVNGPVPGQRISDNARGDNALSPPTDIERQEIHDVANARASQTDVDSYAVKLATAANNAITERYGEQPNPLHWSRATSLAAELLNRGVDIDLARKAIAQCVRTSKNGEPPKSMNYFANVIDDAVKADEMRALNAAHPAPARSVKPARIAVNASADGISITTKHDLEREYRAAKRDAGIAWGKDVGNKEQYRALVAAATKEFADFLAGESPQPWAVRARDSRIVDLCADAAGFPAFDVWIRQNRHKKNTTV